MKIGTTDYTFVRIDKDAKGQFLVVRSGASDRDTNLIVKDLPADSWLRLAEPKLDALNRKDLVTGVFLAFDRNPDVKAARRLLDQAASSGADVTVWIKRLEAAEAERKARQARAAMKKTDDSKDKDAHDEDPIIGKWRIVIHHRKKPKMLNVDFKKGGKSTDGKWEYDETAGKYRWTAPDGATIQMRIEGNEIIGATSGGAKVTGIREISRPTKK